MKRGTTPTLTFKVSSEDGSPMDLTNADIYVTLKEKASGAEIEKTGDDLDLHFNGSTTRIRVTLAQEDTLLFKAGKQVRVQIRYKIGDIAMATDIASVSFEEILKEGVI